MNGLLHASWLPMLGWTLLHALWEGTLVVLGTALVLRSLRGSSPRLRYAVSVLALLLMVGLPLRHLVSFHRDAPQVLFVQARPASNAQSFTRAFPNPATAMRTRTVEALERVMPWVVAVWALGVLSSLLRLAGGWAWLQRLRWAKSELAPDILQRQLLDLCRRVGLKRAVTLLMCEDLVGPSVVGILRPAILVPAGWFMNLPPDQVEALLAHELAHVLRHDYAVNLLQSILEVVLFYHPGVWWLSRRIRAERELACDTFAARLMGDSLPLAEALTTLERRGLGRAPLDLASTAHGGSLMERITQLLLPPRRTSTAPAFGATGVLTLLLVSGLHLAAQTPDPTPAVAPTIPQSTRNLPDVTIDYKNTALYLRSSNAKDAEGKAIPYTQVFDIKANQVPLNQAWRSFEEALKVGSASKSVEGWSRRSETTPGPRVNLDLNGATPATVLAVLNRLAKEYGVEPYQAPDQRDPGPFVVSAYTLKSGQVVLNFHARQVSPAFLDQLLQSARKLKPGLTIKDDRDADTSTGPKVDAIFEGLTLEELEGRVRKLQAEVR